jgi:AcrR family transcriptional regulator
VVAADLDALAGDHDAAAARVSTDELARELGTSKKTICRHFPDKHSLMSAVLDRQFGAIERTLVAAAEDTQDNPFGERVQRFLIAACGELGRIGAAQLATGRGDAVLRRHVDQRIDTVVYQRLDALFREGPPRTAVGAARTAGRDHPRRRGAAAELAVAARTQLHRGRSAAGNRRHGPLWGDPPRQCR